MSSSDEFAGKVALVTGAGSGIGRATALALAKAGARVVVADISEAGKETVAEIAALGGQANFVQSDVSDAGSVDNMFKQILSWHGRLDYAHNNAGTLVQEVLIDEMEESAWDRAVAVNLKSVFLCMKQEIGIMKGQGGGVIVNTSSVSGVRTSLKSAAYSASKAGVLALTRIGAAENGLFNIRVNAIAPAGIETAMLKQGMGIDEERRKTVAKTRTMGRLGSPDEVADAVLWLFSPRASYVTGHMLAVDGGVLIAP